MTIIPHNSGEPQLIRMVDQDGQAVMLDVRQDGRPPGLVLPGKRTRFKIRAHALAYRVNRVILPECPDDWHVHDVRVGGQSQLVSVADSPEEDGFPGMVLSSDTVGCFLSFPFQMTQTGMDLVLDVAYHGPMEGGAPFCCHLQCTAAYVSEVLDLTRINTQMFEGTIRVLGQQNMTLHQQVLGLTDHNMKLLRALEEVRGMASRTTELTDALRNSIRTT